MAKKKDPLEYLKALPAARVAALAKAAGFDDEAEDDEDEDDEAEDMNKSQAAAGGDDVAVDALRKSMDALEAEGARQQQALDLDALLGEAEGEADKLDGSGFVKSLVKGTRGALEGVAASLDEVGRQLDVQGTLVMALGQQGLADRQNLAELRQSIGGVAADLADLRKSLKLPEAPRTFTAKPAERFPEGKGGKKKDGADAPPLSKGMARKKLQAAFEAAATNGDQHRAHAISNEITRLESTDAMTDLGWSICRDGEQAQS